MIIVGILFTYISLLHTLKIFLAEGVSAQAIVVHFKYYNYGQVW